MARLTILFVAHTADTSPEHLRAHIPIALANSMAKRGHNVLIASCKPVCRVLHPLYRLWRWLYETSLPLGITPCPRRGIRNFTDFYHLHPAIHILPYVFSDRNRTIQKLRKTICDLAPDVCVCGLTGGEQLVWTVTLLGSGVPFVHLEFPKENTFVTKEAKELHEIAMYGADRIILYGTANSVQLSHNLRERIRTLPISENDISKTEEFSQESAEIWETTLKEAAASKKHTVMDSFREEPFASMARLFALSRREWLWREFGQPFPNTPEGWLLRQPWASLLRKFAFFSGFSFTLLGNLALDYLSRYLCT